MGPFGVGGGGLVDGGDGGYRLDEEVVPAETGVAFAAVRIQDPERRPPSRRAISIAFDPSLRALADDVAPEPDPRAPGEFEPQTGRRPDRGHERTADPGRLEDHEERLGTTGERRQPTQPGGDVGRAVRGRQPATGEIQEEQVHGPAGEQGAGDGQALIERGRGDDHEPLQTDAAGDRLDRIEGAGEIQPRDHGTRCLGLGDQPERDRGPAAGPVAADGDAGGPGQPARSQDGIQTREPGPDDPLVGPDLGERRDTGERRVRERVRQRLPVPQRVDRERPDDLRSCRTPAGLKARQGCRHGRGEGRHPVLRIEQMFYPNQDPPSGEDACPTIEACTDRTPGPSPTAAASNERSPAWTAAVSRTCGAARAPHRSSS